MTEHSKPTPGACRVFDNPTSNYGLEVRSDVPVKAKQVICRFGGPDRASNANLVAEAFNVLHETGLTPRELQKQRDELHSHLDGVASEMPVRFMDVPDGGSPTLGEQVARMRQALGTAEKQRDELLAELRSIAEWWPDSFAARTARAAIAKVSA